MPSKFNVEGARYLPLPAIAPTGGRGYIRDVSSELWFSPLQPVKPVAPSRLRVRQWQFQPGANILWQPGTEDTGSTGFWILRQLADSWDLLRLAIETVKDRIAAVPWEIRLKPKPGERKGQLAERAQKDWRIDALTKLFQSPDGVYSWSEWVRMVLEDMLVLDAASIYLERDLEGRIASLRVIDGSTINRLITEQGFTPSPPDTAYQQVLYGIPMISLTTDDLVYAMRNPRTWRRYGFGPVEQILVTIAIGLKRQQFSLKYYTEGNMPEAMVFLPSDVPIARIKETQDWFDSVLAGNLSRRRRVTFLPGYGTGKEARPNVVFPKEALLKDSLDEWLWQIVAFNLGISPQALLKMMNRATAEQAVESSEEEGLEPKITWMINLMNHIVQEKMGLTDLEFARRQRREMDALKQAQVDKIYVDSGIRTRNQIREELGDDPDDSPEASQLGVMGPAGFTPLHREPGEESSPAGGKPNGGENVIDVKAEPAEKLLKAAELSINGDKLTTNAHTGFLRLEEALIHVFREQREKAAEEAAKLMKKKDTAEEKADAIYDAIKQAFIMVIPVARATLEEAMLSGGLKGILELEISDAAMISKVNTIARDWAAERAAEMVGMKYNDAGELIPNPNPKFAISDTTRSELRRMIRAAFEDETKMADLAKTIQEAGAFSEKRAAMIARTEVSNAQVKGNWEVWKQSGLVKKVRWLTSFEGPCPVCEQNEDVTVEFGKPFPSGDMTPLAHPNCRCILIAVEVAEG
jgi:hypothetical protein